jgi:hypothetical protein
MSISNDLDRRLEVALASGSARDEIKTLLGSTAGSIIYVAKDGVDTADGSRGAPVLTVTRALALVSATRLVVSIGPGEFEEAATLVWPTRKDVCVVGAGSDLTSIAVPVATATSVITVTPGAQTSSYTGLLADVEIVHEGSTGGEAQSGITFSNASMGKKLGFNIKRCTFSPDETTDKSINMGTHTDADNSVRIYVTGDGNQSEIGGATYFKFYNLADRLHFESCWLIGTITTSSDALEGRIRLYKCIVPHGAATAGGNAMQYITSVCSYSWIDYDDLTPEIYAALDTADLAGSHSEVIVG